MSWIRMWLGALPAGLREDMMHVFTEPAAFDESLAEAVRRAQGALNASVAL